MKARRLFGPMALAALATAWACDDDDDGVMRMFLQRKSGDCWVTIARTEKAVDPALLASDQDASATCPPSEVSPAEFQSGSETLRVAIDYGVAFEETAADPSVTLHTYYDGIEAPSGAAPIPRRAGDRRGAFIYFTPPSPRVGSQLAIAADVSGYGAQLDRAATAIAPVVDPPLCERSPCVYVPGLGTAAVTVRVGGIVPRTVDVLSFVDGVQQPGQFSAMSELRVVDGSAPTSTLARVENIPVPSRAGANWELVARVGGTLSHRAPFSVQFPGIGAPVPLCASSPCTVTPGVGTVQVQVEVASNDLQTVEVLSYVDGVLDAKTWSAPAVASADGGVSSRALVRDIPVPNIRENSTWELAARVGAAVSPRTRIALEQTTVNILNPACTTAPCTAGVGRASVDVVVSGLASRAVQLVSEVNGVRDPTTFQATTVPLEDGGAGTHALFSDVPVPAIRAEDAWTVRALVNGIGAATRRIDVQNPTIEATLSCASPCIIKGGTPTRLTVSAPQGFRSTQAKVSASLGGVFFVNDLTVDLTTVDIPNGRITGGTNLPIPNTTANAVLQVDVNLAGYTNSAPAMVTP